MFSLLSRISLALGFALIVSAILLTGAPEGRAAQDLPPEQGLTPTMEDEIKLMIESYISENPEILLEAIESLRQRDAEKRQGGVKKAIRAKRDELKNSPYSPTGGNPKGDVTIVEFSDYRCPFCKRMMPVTKKLIKEDGNIRIVYKEFPILGTVSTYAAQAALAAWYTQPGKYEAFHEAILAARGDMTEERVLAIADDVGLDSDAIEKAMIRPEVNKEIQRNLKLAAELNITGTPTYIIGRELVPGAVSFEDLKGFVAEARKR